LFRLSNAGVRNGRLLFQFRLHNYLPRELAPTPGSREEISMLGIWTVTRSAVAPIHPFVAPEEGRLVTGCRKVLDHQLRFLFR
jgi:hypothetical protein